MTPPATIARRTPPNHGITIAITIHTETRAITNLANLNRFVRSITSNVGSANRIGGSFFDSVPPAEAYMLKGIIHDWDDIDAIKILKDCRRSINAGGKLLISTSLLKPSTDPDRGNFMDIYMMLLGGRERFEDEFRAILAESGFSLKRVIPMSLQSFILECEPVQRGDNDD
jgi:hypothetical protein